jgi:hypothetical protein
VTEGGIGLSKRVVNGYDRGWVQVRSARDAGRNTAIDYRMTGGSLARRFGELVRPLRAEAVSLKCRSLAGVSCIGRTPARSSGARGTS